MSCDGNIYYRAKNKFPTKVKKAIYIINFFHKMRSAHFLVTKLTFLRHNAFASGFMAGFGFCTVARQIIELSIKGQKPVAISILTKFSSIH